MTRSKTPPDPDPSRPINYAGEAPTDAQRELERARRRQLLLAQIRAGVVPYFAARRPHGRS